MTNRDPSGHPFIGVLIPADEGAKQALAEMRDFLLDQADDAVDDDTQRRLRNISALLDSGLSLAALAEEHGVNPEEMAPAPMFDRRARHHRMMAILNLAVAVLLFFTALALLFSITHG